MTIVVKTKPEGRQTIQHAKTSAVVFTDNAVRSRRGKTVLAELNPAYYTHTLVGSNVFGPPFPSYAIGLPLLTGLLCLLGRVRYELGGTFLCIGAIYALQTRDD